MNKLPVYLYPNLLEVILDLDENRSIHKIMYQRKLQIQKGFKDTVQVQFKNSDQKPLVLDSSSQYWFDMIDSNGRQLVISKQLIRVDDNFDGIITEAQTVTNTVLYFSTSTGISLGQTVTGTGIAAGTTVTNVSNNGTTVVTLSKSTTVAISSGTSLHFETFCKRGITLADFEPIETVNLVAGSYKFIVKKLNQDGTFTPAYSNTYYGITGEVEIVEDGFPLGYPIQTIDMKRLESAQDYDRTFGSMGYVFTSDWFRPMVRSSNTDNSGTAIISLASFVGEITIEGTEDNSPSSQGHANAQAFTITTYTTSTVTEGIVSISWNAATTAVRFKVKPARDGLGSNYYPTGKPIGSFTNKFPSGFVAQIQYIS